MTEESAVKKTAWGLLIKPAGKNPKVLVDYLKMFLGYRYGIELMEENDVMSAAIKLKDEGKGIRCVLAIQNQSMGSRTSIAALSRNGASPFFLLVPRALLGDYEELCAGMENVFLWDWERVLSKKEPSLLQIIVEAFSKNGIKSLFDGTEDLPYSDLQQKIAEQVSHIDTLPAFPDLVMRLMRVIRDPNAEIEEIEKIISSDPSLMWKLLEVMKTPALAGRRRSDWTLRDVIMRLGIKKVGSIVQQIQLMNSFVTPQDNPFDLRRFWEHSVGTALIADKISSTGAISFETDLEFNDYWLGTLLHDIGKFVLGLFYAEHFSKIADRIDPGQNSRRDFREVEAVFGYAGLHEDIARMLLFKVDAGPGLVEGVANHHTGGENPSDLVSLIHVSNNISKELGLGYLAEEKAVLSPAVLQKLEMTEESVLEIGESLRESVLGEIKQVVDSCLAEKKPKKGKKGRSKAKEEKGLSKQELKSELLKLVERMRKRLEQDTIITQERKNDWLIDLEGLHTQLEKSAYNKSIVLAIVKSLAQSESLRELVDKMIDIFEQLESHAEGNGA
ncbi:MAG: HDOD domain-containing protein [Gemmatimonadetes bacterium]|jgi:HD-like signal output (HDOD) protein|nr:HDOD domain-containing protein [Gemmatimonadota bacterium]